MPSTAKLGSAKTRIALREALFSMLFGVGVVFLVHLDRLDQLGWRVVLYGGMTGLLIFLSCRTLYGLVEERIQTKEILPRALVAAVVFFVGGVVGWALGAVLAQAIGLTRWHYSIREFGFGLAVAGCLGLIIGLIFYFFGVMRRRLGESISRLKEAEFAEKELELARSIQSRLLPPAEVSGDGYHVSARNLPARFVAGDFYDVFHLPDGAVGLVVADVSGKGIGASLIMASVKAVVPLIALGHSASETLTLLNRKLFSELSAREFVALCYARFDSAQGTLDLANAGLPDPYLLSVGGRVEALSVPGPRLPLGAHREVAYESLHVAIAPGARVLFVTDGLPEAPSPSGEPLGYEALARLVASACAEPGELLDRLLDSVRAETSGSLEDDWTVLLLESKSAKSAGVVSEGKMEM